MNFRFFNNYMNAVVNAIDAQHNHLDGQAEITFTNNGKWALHKLEKFFKDKDQDYKDSFGEHQYTSLTAYLSGK